MKKVLLAMSFLLVTIISLAQTKKWNQYSIRGGVDNATKQDAIYITKPLKGFDIGASFDKYWSWYGVGVDVDFLQNAKPDYDEANIRTYLTAPTGFGSGLMKAPWISAVPENATKLNRAFIGIGPSIKLQDKKNKIVAELLLRGGITSTSGSALDFGTTAVAGPGTFYHKDGTGGSDYVYYHKGYTNDLLATAKAALRVNYYVKPNIGINLGAHYMHYWGSAASFDYLDMTTPPYASPKSSPWYINLPVNQGLTTLSSLGFTAGVTYRIGNFTNAPTVKKATTKSSATITVKDELTGQGIIGAAVTLTNANGKSYNAITNAQGIASFEKIEDGVYSAKAELNNIATNEQSFSVAKSNATAQLTHNDPRFTVVGKAINKSNNQPESGVSVSLKNNDKGSVKMATSQSGSGSFSFQIDANSDYQLVGKKDSYISNIEKVSTKGLTRSQTLYVELEVGVEKVEAGKALTLQNIYYDLNKANVKQDASSDLEKLTIFLQDNPSFKVEIASHTDNQGADDYNLKLSLERAQNVVTYLVSKGISKDRLEAKGYGETLPVNSCTTCTEAEHQQNRRTEFKVIN